jgi:hypothetical protein
MDGAKRLPEQSAVEYSALAASKDGARVSVDLTNTGKRTEREAVELFVEGADQPLASAEVILEAGQTKTVEFQPAWPVCHGVQEIRCGPSKGEIRSQTTVRRP